MLSRAKKQDLLDTIVHGLAQQGWKRAYNDVACKCVYRTADGLKCAFGMLIPDELYIPALDNLGGVGSLASVACQEAEGFRAAACRAIFKHIGVDPHDAEAVEFLNKIQQLHDSSREKPSPEVMRAMFRGFILGHDLTLPPEL